MHNIETNKNLATLNTLQLPATASAYAVLKTERDIAAIACYAMDHSLPIIPFGEGSNLVLGRHINALVVGVENRGITVLREGLEHIDLRVAAGENWHGLVEHCLERGWHGLENLALIPGSVGAAPVQNIGAYGVEVSSFITRIAGFSLPKLLKGGRPVIQHLSAEDCEFSYRNSLFKTTLRDAFLITHIELRLHKKFKATIDYPALKAYLSAQRVSLDTLTAEQAFKAVIAIRNSKLPAVKKLPNVGSFFQNVVLNDREFNEFVGRFPDAPRFCQRGVYKIPAAWLIEQCGYKGKRFGAIGMHAQQALVLVNYLEGEVPADAACVLTLAREIAVAVEDKFGLTLQIEPRIYGV